MYPIDITCTIENNHNKCLYFKKYKITEEKILCSNTQYSLFRAIKRFSNASSSFELLL